MKSRLTGSFIQFYFLIYIFTNIVGSLLCDSIELDVLYIESHLKTVGLLCYYIYAGWREDKKNIFMMKQPESVGLYMNNIQPFYHTLGI